MIICFLNSKGKGSAFGFRVLETLEMGKGGASREESMS